MKTYVITLSQKFPAKHPRKGELTNFNNQLLNAVWRSHNMSVGFPQFGMKLHTIRANYPLWKKRFEQIEAGKAILSVRYWTGNPYASKQMEICKLSAKDGIGIQKFEVWANYAGINNWQHFKIDDHGYMSINDIPNKDGLSREDWINWFKNYDITKPMAIIHFTNYRY